jgi:transposase
MQSAVTSKLPTLTIALDIGNRYTEICSVDAAGTVVERDRVRTTAEVLRQRLAVDPARVVLEVGCDSPWISRLLLELGHEVFVANPRTVALINRSDRKTDRSDAEKLARLARVDPALLQPIQHRGEATQCDLAIARARDQLVSLRTALINHVRGTCKSLGERLQMCSAEAFAKKASTAIPELLAPALRPLMAQIESINRAITDFDRQIERLSKERYPVTKLLRQVRGVGPVTAFCYVLTIEDPSRFGRSRHVGPYLGLTPRKRASGDSDPKLSITKAGDPMMRRLLVNAAQYMLSRNGSDCDLRRFGERICEAGGKTAKKRAVVAVARKTAVLLHRLWTTGEVYDPLRNSRPEVA